MNTKNARGRFLCSGSAGAGIPMGRRIRPVAWTGAVYGISVHVGGYYRIWPREWFLRLIGIPKIKINRQNRGESGKDNDDLGFDVFYPHMFDSLVITTK